MEILWYFCGPALAAFLFQYFIGNRTKYKLLRHIPLYVFVLTLLAAMIALKADAGFVIGGNFIAALLWIILGVCVLLGYALAVFALKIRK